MSYSELREKREAEHGYREVSGKEARLAEWRAKQGGREFAKLCRRLRHNRWNARNRDHIRVYARARYQRLRRESAAVRECPACEAQWCKVPSSRRSTAYCSRRCYARSPRGLELAAKALRVAAAKRRRRRAQSARLIDCAACGARWCVVPGARGSKCCSGACYYAHMMATSAAFRERVEGKRAARMRGNAIARVCARCGAQWTKLPRALGYDRYCGDTCSREAASQLERERRQRKQLKTQSEHGAKS